ncbi:hypothetical protein JCM6882_004730 [Rhodosporidiobolus microsporus]
MSPSLHHHHPPSSSTAATAKGQHYALTLDTARRLALTAAPYPALAKSGAVNLAAVGTGLGPSTAGRGARGAGGAGQGAGGGASGSGAGAGAGAGQLPQGVMDWKELLRKFVKHNPHRTVTAQTASLDHTLRTLLLKSASAAPSSSPSISSLLSSPPSFALSAFPLPPTLLPTDVPAALTALEAMQAHLDAHAGAGTTPAEVNSAKVVLAWGRYLAGESEAALRELKEVERGVPATLGDGMEAYDVVLRVLAHAVEAFAHDRLSAPSAALAAYESAARAYDEACELLARAAPGGQGLKEDVELHRVGGGVLFRACLMARENGSPSDAYSLHNLYLRRSSAFLALHGSTSRSSLAFPPSQRATILRSLRSFLSSPSPPSSLPAPSAPDRASTFTALNRAQEKLVREHTSVPKAGETNGGYLRFLDEVVESWRGEGAPRERAGEVVSILHSALTHTIQSHLLLRHLIHALTLAGRYHEAAQALRLYRAYGDKSRETDARAVGEEMRRLKREAKEGGLESTREREEEEKEEEGGEKSGEKAEEKTEQQKNEERAEKQEQQAEDARRNPTLPSRTDENPYLYDLDPDFLFLRTLTFGVRLLLKHAPAVFPRSTPAVARKEAAREAMGLAKRVREVWEESGEVGIRGDERRGLEGEVEWALGVAEGRMAELDAHPSHRASLQSSSLSHLRTASSLAPSSFPIALSLAHALLTLPPPLRDVPAALSTAKRAVELAPRRAQDGVARKEAWHLLALAVSAAKDMKGALEVLETAVDEDEEDLATPTAEGASLLEQDLDTRWFTPSNQTDLLSARLQLRLTKAAVVEYLEGASSALEEQQDALAFFAREVALITDEPEQAKRRDGEPSLRDGRLTPSTKAQQAIKQAGLSPDYAAGAGVAAKPHRKTSILGRRRSQKKQANANANAASEAAPSSAPPSIVVDGSVTSPSPMLSPSASPLAAPSTAGNSTTTLPGAPRAGPVLRPELERNPRARLLLAKVWLACAGTFRRMGKVEEARGAVAEAEGLVGWEEGDGEEVAEVWSQLALVHFASSTDPTPAREALTKALSFSPSHIPSLVLLARVYLTPPPSSASPTAGAAPPPPPSHLTSSIPPPSTPIAPHLSLQLPLAEALLSTLTASSGTAGETSPEAWFELSRCYNLVGGRTKEERECLVKALALEESRAVRDIAAAVGAIA